MLETKVFDDAFDSLSKKFKTNNFSDNVVIEKFISLLGRDCYNHFKPDNRNFVIIDKNINQEKEYEWINYFVYFGNLNISMLCCNYAAIKNVIDRLLDNTIIYYKESDNVYKFNNVEYFKKSVEIVKIKQ